jgi:hypothetical protein
MELEGSSVSLQNPYHTIFSWIPTTHYPDFCFNIILPVSSQSLGPWSVIEVSNAVNFLHPFYQIGVLYTILFRWEVW